MQREGRWADQACYGVEMTAESVTESMSPEMGTDLRRPTVVSRDQHKVKETIFLYPGEILETVLAQQDTAWPF